MIAILSLKISKRVWGTIAMSWGQFQKRQKIFSGRIEK